MVFKATSAIQSTTASFWWGVSAQSVFAFATNTLIASSNARWFDSTFVFGLLNILVVNCQLFCSYDTTSRRKQSDRSKRSHHRRSPTSSRHGHRQRHREEREDRSQSTSRRRHRDRVAKDRSPVKVKTIQYFLYNFSLSCIQFSFVCLVKFRNEEKKIDTSNI